jgi:DNA-binding NtrC family response regulator
MTDPHPTILIIDNDEGMVAALAARLGACGYRCVTAGSGAQGIAAFHAHEVDLVITDLNMPAGDGVALARSVRRLSQVPIIIVTGYRDNFRRELRSIRNVTLVEKPFESNQFIDLVDTALVLKGRPLPMN